MDPMYSNTPNMEYHRKAAKALLKAYRANNSTAVALFHEQESYAAKSGTQKKSSLSDAQFIYAQQQGHSSWTKLRDAVESQRRGNGAADSRSLLDKMSIGLGLSIAYRPQIDVEIQVYWIDARGHRIDLGSSANHREFLIPRNRFWMIEPRGELDDSKWEQLIYELKNSKIPGFVGGAFLTNRHLATLSEADHLQYLSLDSCQRISGKGLRDLAGLSQLRYLSLQLNIPYWGTPMSLNVNDGDMDFLSEMDQLEELDISTLYRVTDKVTGFLPRLDNLWRVGLSMTSTGDGVMKHLESSSKLERITCGTRLTDEGLNSTLNFPRFLADNGRAKLELMKCPEITDSGLTVVGKLHGVSTLCLPSQVQLIPKWMKHMPQKVDNRISFTSTGIQNIQEMASLKNLVGVDAELANDGALEALGRMPRLESIAMGDAIATDKGFAALSHSKSLVDIAAWNAQRITTVDSLANLPQLRHLFIGGPYMRDDGLRSLKDFSALQRFWIARNNAFTDGCFKYIAQAPMLNQLSNMYLEHTGDKATEHIMNAPHLREYTLYSTIKNHSLATNRSLKMLGSKESLENLTFDLVQGITNTGIRELERLPRLKRLEVTGCEKISGDAFQNFHKRVSVIYRK